MTRAVAYPLTSVLALVTAVALLRAGMVLDGARVDPPPPPAAATEAAVRRFYDDVNAAIRSGDAVALAATISADFVDHAPPPGVTPDRAGLARYLAALRATVPEAELVVEELVTVGDRALARLAVRGAQRGSFLGLPLGETTALWGALDVLRVAEGRVVERWSTSDGLALLEPLGRVALGAPLPTHQAVALERLAVPAGGHIEAALPDEARLVYLEAGPLAVAVAPGSPGSALLAAAGPAQAARPATEIGPGSSRTLAAGDLLALPPLTAYTLRNDGEGTAHALVVALLRPGAAGYTTARCDSANPDVAPSCSAGAAPASPEVEWSCDVEWSCPGGEDPTAPTGGGRDLAGEIVARPLAGGRTSALPPRPLAVAIGRATLAPGAELPVHAAGPTLLYLEAGTLELEAGDGDAWVRRGTAGTSSDVPAGTLTAGDGAQLEAGTVVACRNPGDTPAVVLVVTILPTDQAGTIP